MQKEPSRENSNPHIQNEHGNVEKYSEEFQAFYAANLSFEYDFMKAILLTEILDLNKSKHGIVHLGKCIFLLFSRFPN